MLKRILVGGFLIIMLGAVIAGAISLFANAEEPCTTSKERGQGNFARLGVDAQGQVARQVGGRSDRELDANPNDLLEDAQGNGYGRARDIRASDVVRTGPRPEQRLGR
jgi:hypothetical protein